MQQGIKVDKTILEECIADYRNGMTAKQCADKYSLGTRTVYRYLKQYGISTIVRIDSEVLKVALEDYKENKLTATDCAEKYGIGRTTVFRKLKENCLEKNYPLPRHTYNNRFFENIDTEAKAYWLGFIAADGNISKVLSTVEIGLQSGDKKHLEKFVESLSGTQLVKPKKAPKARTGFGYDPQQSVRVSITSRQMCKDLIANGIIPKKSLVLKFPNNIDNDLLRHFIRGYFDGDGCLSTSGTWKNTGFQFFIASIAGTKDFLTELVNKLEPIGITPTKILEHDSIYEWKKKGSKQLRLFLDFIYADCTIYLERKYQRYLEFCRLTSKSLKG